MGILNWIEKKVFLGEVLRDYGILHQENTGLSSTKTSALLCHRKGADQLVFRVSSKAILGASVNYVMVELTPDLPGRLREIAYDVERRINEKPKGYV